MADEKAAKKIEPPNECLSKVRIGGPLAVTDDVLEQAQADLPGLSALFFESIEEDIEALDAKLKEMTDDPDSQKEVLDEIARVAHDVTGNGGTLGYDLLTVVGNQLRHFLENATLPLNELGQEVVELHIYALHAIFTQKLSGDGGDIGAELMSGLTRIIEKWEASA